MLEKLIRWCLGNRFVVVLAAVLIFFLSVLAMLNTSVDALPDIGENQQVIMTEWMGRDARTIEDQVTYPLTSALFGIKGVKSIRASSSFGFSMVYVVFEDSIPFYESRTRILEKLQQVSARLPANVIPSLGPDSTGLGQVFWYTLEGGGLGPEELRGLQDWFVRYQLSAVSGVSEVSSIGGFVRQYQVEVDPMRLSEYGIPFMDVVAALKGASLDVGARVIEQGGRELTVRGLGVFRSRSDIENVAVRSKDGTPLTLKMLGSVTLGPDYRRGLLDKGGMEAVGGVVVVRYKENALAVIARVKEKIGEIEKGLPPGVRIVPFYDRTELIGRTVDTLRDTLVQEVIMTVVIMFLFLMHLRSSLIISVTLPAGVLLSFLLMRIFQIDANIMSLSGIAIAIGSLVDTGIVMTENAYRHLLRDQGRKPRIESIIAAAAEVGPAIVTGILTTLLSFLPVFFMSGQEGKLFHPLAFTKTFALTGAIIITITLVPVLTYYLLRGRLRPVEENPAARLIVNTYERILRLVLSHRRAFFALTGGIVLTALLLIAFKLGNEFMPPFDEGTVLFMPVVAPSVSLTEAARILRLQDQIIGNFPEVKTVVGKAGRVESALDPAPVEMFETVIELKPRREWRKGMTKEKLMHDLNEALNIPGVANIWTQPIVNRIDMLSTGIRTPVGIKIFGGDPKVLERLADEIAGVVRRVKGAEDVYAEKITGKPYLEIEPDRKELARYGLSMEEVLRTVEMGVGGENAAVVYEGRERYTVSVRFSRELRDSPEKVRRLLIPVMGRGSVPLGRIARVEITEGPAMINSENGRLRAYVLMNVRGRDLVGFVEEARRTVDREMKGKIPSGYALEWSGRFENQVRANRVILFILPIVLLINYMLIYRQFRSHRKAATIFAVIPLSFSGGIIMLALYGFNMSIAVWVGFIAIAGVVVDDGLLITTYLDQVFKEKPPITREDVIEATVMAGKARVRPAFMTNITSIAGLLPIFLFDGTGIEVMRPMAIPSMGGMIASYLAFFVVPAVYSWFELRKRGLTGQARDIKTSD